jgi:hypothetical protein
LLPTPTPSPTELFRRKMPVAWQRAAAKCISASFESSCRAEHRGELIAGQPSANCFASLACDRPKEKRKTRSKGAKVESETNGKPGNERRRVTSLRRLGFHFYFTGPRTLSGKGWSHFWLGFATYSLVR